MYIKNQQFKDEDTLFEVLFDFEIGDQFSKNRFRFAAAINVGVVEKPDTDLERGFERFSRARLVIGAHRFVVPGSA